MNRRVIAFHHLFLTRLVFFHSLHKLSCCSLLLLLECLHRFGLALKSSSSQEWNHEFKKAWFLRNWRRHNPLSRFWAKKLKAYGVSIRFWMVKLERADRPAIQELFPIECQVIV